MRSVVGLIVLLWVSGVQAGIRNYIAPLDQSQWHLEQSNPLQCTLTHNIPRYGRAVFISHASKQLNLHFTLEMRRKPDATTPAKVRSIAPIWRPGRHYVDIADLYYFSHFDGELPKKEAWVMLSELEQGMQPTFFYQDWNSDDEVQVGLSAANFGNGYQAFVDCLDGLLPYSFDDIAFSVLHYQDKQGRLTAASKKRLEQIVEYLELDPEVELVLVDSFTDSFGMSDENQVTTGQQGKDIKGYLVQAGIPAGRIKSESHGEKRHVATNNTSSGRQLNRRVVVRMNRHI